MAYANYDYYRDEYHGSKITEADYAQLSLQADAYIDALTFCRLRDGAAVTKWVQLAACAVADAIARYAVTDADANNLKSESTDGYSVSYKDEQQLAVEKMDAMYNAAGLYLPPSDPLRYRGCG